MTQAAQLPQTSGLFINGVNYRKNTVFQGLEGIWAPKSEPLGPQSCAHEGSGAVKVASQRARMAKSSGSSRLVCQSYGPGLDRAANQAEIK